jgi:hypothetical protein
MNGRHNKETIMTTIVIFFRTQILESLREDSYKNAHFLIFLNIQLYLRTSQKAV